MATIENNTEGLQRILQLANSLPNAGSGVEIQETDGGVTFQTSNGAATVNCGFKPDLVTIYLGDVEGEPTYITAYFGDSVDVRYCTGYDPSDTYCNGFVSIYRTSNGFTLGGFNWYTDGWDKQTSNGETYQYYACKFR